MKISFKAVLLARCPACLTGKVTRGGFAIRPVCPHCGYNLYPEPGFYLGAMVVGFLVSAILMVPPLIVLKLLDASMTTILVFPFVEYLFLGSFLMYYCRILWLHLEYHMSRKLDG